MVYFVYFFTQNISEKEESSIQNNSGRSLQTGLIVIGIYVVQDTWKMTANFYELTFQNLCIEVFVHESFGEYMSHGPAHFAKVMQEVKEGVCFPHGRDKDISCSHIPICCEGKMREANTQIKKKKNRACYTMSRGVVHKQKIKKCKIGLCKEYEIHVKHQVPCCWASGLAYQGSEALRCTLEQSEPYFETFQSKCLD